MEERTFSVSHLNSQLHKHITRGPFKNIYVKGEVSNLYTAKSGHAYFKLKDDKSVINCVAFRRVLKKGIKPENGINVIIKGSVEVYKEQGKYQIKVNSIKKDGQGQLFEKLQKLTERLEKEGLFKDDHKKEIKQVPQKIGVITSKTGAAIKDIKTTIERRWPYCTIYIFHSLVQGEDAPKDLVRQLKRADDFGLDTIIIGRGGGSIEDLWAFNDENLARAVYNSKTPIISAVGHERNTTIIDYVADKRAATPTAAAELAVPNIEDIDNKYSNLKTRLENSLTRILDSCRQRLDFVTKSAAIRNPKTLYKEKQFRFDSCIYKIKSSSNKIHDDKRNKLNNLVKSFKYLSTTLQTSKRTELDRLTTEFRYLSNNLKESKRQSLADVKKKLETSSGNMLVAKKTQLEHVKKSHILKNPNKILNPKWQQHIRMVGKVEILNPMTTLKRGYIISRKGEKVISSAEDLNKDDIVELEFKDGKVNTKVI